MKHVSTLLVLCGLVCMLAPAHAAVPSDNRVLEPDWSQPERSAVPRWDDKVAPDQSQVFAPNWDEGVMSPVVPAFVTDELFCHSIKSVLAKGVRAAIGKKHDRKQGDRFSVADGTVFIPGTKHCGVWTWDREGAARPDYRCLVTEDHCSRVRQATKILVEDIRNCLPSWTFSTWVERVDWVDGKPARSACLLGQGRVDGKAAKIYVTVLNPAIVEKACTAQVSFK